MKLYLASESAPRRELFDRLNIPFAIIKHSVDEDAIMHTYSSPQQAVSELARAKAVSAGEMLSLDERAEAVIVGCDTMNYRSGKLFGKPKNNSEARAMLELLLSGADTAWTGICIIEPNRPPLVQAFCAEYRFSNLAQEDIDQYVKSGEPLKYAGGFAPMSKFALSFCTTMKGSYQCIYSLPIEPLIPVLRRNGLLPDVSIKRITLCSSASFFDRLQGISDELSKRGIDSLLPSMTDYHHLEEDALAKIHFDLIRAHFRKINRSDAVYVANFEKNGIPGYIGGNSFLEMGKAFDKNIPIFLREEIPSNISYREELLAMKPIVIGEDWDRLELHLKK